MVLYSLGRFFIEGLRTDSLMFFGLRIAQIISIIGIVIGIIIIFIANRNNKKKLNIMSKNKVEQPLKRASSLYSFMEKL